ncbi:hypothetical protein BD560DRAFT_489239 [Blakeslea trispora]|nr:hypothetical protein BD560DRAFT_489239 [Blakeslea trispora]
MSLVSYLYINTFDGMYKQEHVSSSKKYLSMRAFSNYLNSLVARDDLIKEKEQKVDTLKYQLKMEYDIPANVMSSLKKNLKAKKSKVNDCFFNMDVVKTTMKKVVLPLTKVEKQLVELKMKGLEEQVQATKNHVCQPHSPVVVKVFFPLWQDKEHTCHSEHCLFCGRFLAQQQTHGVLERVGVDSSNSNEVKISSSNHGKRSVKSNCGGKDKTLGLSTESYPNTSLSPMGTLFSFAIRFQHLISFFLGLKLVCVTHCQDKSILFPLGFSNSTCQLKHSEFPFKGSNV